MRLARRQFFLAFGALASFSTLGLLYKRRKKWFLASAKIARGSHILHIPFLGQSNAEGSQSTPPLSIVPTGFGSLKFRRGVLTWLSNDHPEAPESRASFEFDLVELTAEASETRANGMADSFANGLAPLSPIKQSSRVLVSSPSLGSRKLTELGPEDHASSGEPGARTPGGFWPTLIDDMRRAKARAEALGCEYSIPFWNYDQGENEGNMRLYANGPLLASESLIDSYSAKAVKMVDLFARQAQALTKTGALPPCLVTPPCSNQIAPTAWLDAMQVNDLAVVVGPRYQMPSALESIPSGAPIHYNPDGQRWIGEMIAKVALAQMATKTRWKPLYARKAVRKSDKQIEVKFHVPCPPLVLDTESWPRLPGWGFHIYTGAIDAKGLIVFPSSIKISELENSVILDFSDKIPLGSRISIGSSNLIEGADNLTVLSSKRLDASANGIWRIEIDRKVSTILNKMPDSAILMISKENVMAMIRSWSDSNAGSILTGLESEISPDLSEGMKISLAMPFARTNLRDSDPTLSLNQFAFGHRKGKHYPLYNWLCQYEGLVVEDV